MTIHHREAFLDNIAHKLRRPRRTEGVVKPEWSLQPQKEVLADASTEELINVLEEQCKVIHTDFKRTTKEGLAAVLQETIANYQGKSIILANDPRHEAYDLHSFYDALEMNGTKVHIWDEAIGKENQVIAERADVGINFSDITLAESGTVGLYNDKNNGRSISLLPQTFIAIIPKESIVPRLTQATKQVHEGLKTGKDVPSCLSLVTGPSNSADIEMKLIVGVHGPIKATYIVVD